MKNIRIFEDFHSMKMDGHNNSVNYMFFQNLSTIKHAIDDILSMDKKEVDQILSKGHNWALDHISTSADDIQEVYNFLKHRVEIEEETGDEETTMINQVEIISDEDKGFEEE